MTVEDPALYRGAPGATTFSVPLVQLPAHIYSLDFITLGLALRHFADPLGSVDIGVLAENLKVGPDSPISSSPQARRRCRSSRMSTGTGSPA